MLVAAGADADDSDRRRHDAADGGRRPGDLESRARTAGRCPDRKARCSRRSRCASSSATTSTRPTISARRRCTAPPFAASTRLSSTSSIGARSSTRATAAGWTALAIANGLTYTDFFKQQVHTAKLLRELMTARGLPTEGHAVDPKVCFDCLQTRVGSAARGAGARPADGSRVGGPRRGPPSSSRSDFPANRPAVVLRLEAISEVGGGASRASHATLRQAQGRPERSRGRESVWGSPRAQALG